MILGGSISIEVAYETNAESDVIQVIARNMASIDLSCPAVTNFDLSIAGRISISDDEVVGKAVLHFTHAPVIHIENPRVALAGATIVNDDVFPASTLNLRVVDGFT